MPSPINDGGPAFPIPANVIPVNVNDDRSYGFPGMTLRHWFVGHCLANPEIVKMKPANMTIVEFCYDIADDAIRVGEPQ